MSSAADAPVARIFLSRIEEEVALTLRMMERVPPEAADWRPDWPSVERPPFTVQELCGHLCDAFSGICAVLVKLTPPEDRRAHDLRARVEAGSNSTVEASVALLSDLAVFLHEGFQRISDSGLTRTLPTVFTAGGKPALTLLLTNLTHFTNHKYQLFLYLKLLGADVGSRDLYRFDA